MSLKGKRFTLAWVRHPRQQNSIFVLAIPNVNLPGKRILARHHRQISTSSQLCTTKLDTYYQRKFVGFFFKKKGQKKHTRFCHASISAQTFNFNIWTTEH